MYAIVVPLVWVFNEESRLLGGGIAEAVSGSAKYIVEFWKWNRETYPAQLGVWKTSAGPRLEITLTQILVGLVVAGVGCVVDSLAFGFIAAIKYVPGVLKWWKDFVKVYADTWRHERSCVWLLMLFPVLVALLMLVPVVLALGVLTAVIAGAACGIHSACVGFLHDRFAVGFAQIYAHVRWFDQWTNEYFIALCDRTAAGSWLPDCFPLPPLVPSGPVGLFRAEPEPVASSAVPEASEEKAPPLSTPPPAPAPGDSNV